MSNRTTEIDETFQKAVAWMEESNKTIDPEKRDRIYKAALAVFATSSYEKASTNDIVQSAGVSKGLLFHYFGSKKELYDSLFVFAINLMYRTVTEKINWAETDLFDRLIQIAMEKIEINRCYPHMFDFIKNVVAEKKVGSMQEVSALYHDYGISFEEIYQDVYHRNVDYTLFKDPAGIPKAINIVRWTLEKYTEENILSIIPEVPLDYDAIAAELQSYVSILKKAFYR